MADKWTLKKQDAADGRIYHSGDIGKHRGIAQDLRE